MSKSNSGRSQGYDLIGDIHGCAHTLETLLVKMGYFQRNGVYQHATRKAVFIGDIIDRGPRIREALHLVKAMVDAGSAFIVMGNHEYNALGYFTLARPGTGHTYLREHNSRHNRLINETLEQFAQYPLEWKEFLEWFYQLPLFLEMDGFRVVHACWDSQLIEAYRQRFSRNTIDEDFLHDSTVKGSFAGKVMDRLLRGTDLKLPEGESITGKDGFVREFFRTKFWSEQPKTYQDVVFQPDPLPDVFKSRLLTEKEKKQLLTYDRSELPLFVGHYWMSGTPRPITPNIVCLDYSAVKYGKLVAYRLDDEVKLSSDKFVWVEVERSENDE
jgi:diadenosine tetraphosphatase ApaH/serine/threonine PP2A family protein phosphatase